MLATAISNVREFLSSWKNLLALGTLPFLGAWIYSRVWMVNPAILGDEYIYAMNARKVSPWDPPAAGDFSNYLFNFVYQSTNLCGASFYSCAKVLNIVFFLGFVFLVFLLGLRVLPFWGAFGFMVLAALSPLSVYTSMFLPEPMFFFFIGLLAYTTVRAIKTFTLQSWLVVGLILGLTSLVKPHAWISAIAIGLTLALVGLTSPKYGIKVTLKTAAALVSAAILSRLLVGFIVAGPKALLFFGQYLGSETITRATQESSLTENTGTPGALTPFEGVLQLFWPQMYIHVLASVSLLGIALVGLLGSLLSLDRRKELSESQALALLASIWLGVMMISIVIFTGWVTGTGDDHTSRVLLRYYDFLFVIVPLAGLAALTRGKGADRGIFARWALAILALIGLTSAFTGFFGGLTIQIADAPNLAGLVVNLDVLNSVAILGAFSLLVYATFPKYTIWAMSTFLFASMVLTGWQTQDQYQIARGTDAPFDLAGKYVSSSYETFQADKFWVLAGSRFNATAATMWANSDAVLPYTLYLPGSVVDSESAPEGASYVLALDEIEVVGQIEILENGDGFKIYQITRD